MNVVNRLISESIQLDVAAARVFDVLADPRQHSVLDGSGTVRAAIEAPQRLFLGARFRMSMQLGIPYKITNQVVEFSEGSRIAWKHWGGHIWRYEVVAQDSDRCMVTESFDYAGARSPWLLEFIGAPERNRRAMKATLVNLQLHFSL